MEMMRDQNKPTAERMMQYSARVQYSGRIHNNTVQYNNTIRTRVHRRMTKMQTDHGSPSNMLWFCAPFDRSRLQYYCTVFLARDHLSMKIENLIVMFCQGGLLNRAFHREYTIVSYRFSINKSRNLESIDKWTTNAVRTYCTVLEEVQINK
jgi:hypothetical protein